MDLTHNGGANNTEYVYQVRCGRMVIWTSRGAAEALGYACRRWGATRPVMEIVRAGSDGSTVVIATLALSPDHLSGVGQ